MDVLLYCLMPTHYHLLVRVKPQQRQTSEALGAALQPDGMMRFWVRDQGQGIPPEVQPRLFVPFSQVGHMHEAGHGLGLSIVRSIVEKLGGQVGVESRVGQGSLFYFTLPAMSNGKTPAGRLPKPRGLLNVTNMGD
jgi:signal transduction histidine kinase